MLGKRARLASAATSPPESIQITAPRDGHWAAEAVVGPPSPLERDPRSPKGWKNREVGLRIVAALQKSGSVGDVAAKAVMSSPRFGGPSLLVASPRTADVCGGCCTGVIFGAGFGPEEKKCGGVFCGVDEEDEGWGVRWGESASLWSSSSMPGAVAVDFRLFPTADFLSSCYLCKKKLHGEDIYMYRGEKAFCSMECRDRQIAIDEYQENWASQVSKPPSVKPMADYSGGRLFCTGVAAA